MKPFSALPILVIFIASCHEASRPSHLPLFLTENTMYSIDTVRMAANGGDEKAATQKLQDAAARFRKSSDTAGSIALFKSAVRLNPTAKSYFELGGVLIAAHYYTEALMALNISERLGYTPTANLMARYALVYSRRDGGDGQPSSYALHYMELAIQMGYAHPREFTQKDLFPNLSGNAGFDEVYASAVGGGPGIEAEKGLWEGFGNQFPELSLPLVINRKWMQDHSNGPEISLQYEKFIPEMRDAHFAREENYDYYYVGAIHRDANYIAIIYSMEMQSAEGDSSQVYTLVSYDRHGKIIDLMPVAGRKDQKSNFSVFSILPNMQFKVQEIETAYKEDPEDAGYDSSNIKGQIPHKALEYRIAKSGKFELVGSPLAAR